MVDNQGNTHGAAPDRGSMNGPILTVPEMDGIIDNENKTTRKVKRDSDFWMDTITHGQVRRSVLPQPSSYDC